MIKIRTIPMRFWSQIRLFYHDIVGNRNRRGGFIMAIDPVCKMTVDEKKAVATSEYKGKKYYFCAVGCKKTFDANPEKHLAK
jgi:YHS domain-containing protein